MAAVAQTCSTPGCSRTAAFSTRTKPAWCSECLVNMLAELRMDPVTDFPGNNVRWRTRCRDCAAECDYRLAYLLELTTRDEPACRRCHWTRWAAMYGGGARPVSAQDVAECLDRNGFDPVEEVRELPNGELPVLTRCRQCGMQSAQRLGDIGWGCTCTRNNPSNTNVAAKPKRGSGKKNLLGDSGLPALEWWDREVNDEADLKTATVRATRSCHWICPECGHKFQKAVYLMSERPECPVCEKKRSAEWALERERLKRTPIADIPELMAAWAEDEDPRFVMAGSHGLRKFACSNGHRPRMSPSLFLQTGCTFCRTNAGKAEGPPRPMLRQVLPEIASQWHPTKNGTKLTPDTVTPDSKRTVWWLAECCGYEWEEQVKSRNKYKRQHCPQCQTILDSLGWVDPGLAAEWDPANPLTPWHVRPNAQTSFMPAWICSVDPSHRWEAALSSRSNGAECPDCRESGKSRIELDHLSAAKTVFKKVRSGAVARDSVFATRKSWTIDILIEREDTRVAVEYDGAYWHSPEPKRLVDQRKTLDLLSAGYKVVRLREDSLPSLEVDSPEYLEIRVYSTAPQPDRVITEISEWLGQ